MSFDIETCDFIKADKNSVSLTYVLPSKDDFREMLNSWGYYAGRARKMKSNRLNCPQGYTPETVPPLRLFPELPKDSIQESVVWTLYTKTKPCYKENCMWGQNCTSGYHLKNRTTLNDYLDNVVMYSVFSFDYIKTGKVKTGKSIDYLKDKIVKTWGQIEVIEKEREKLIKKYNKKQNKTNNFEFEQEMISKKSTIQKLKNDLDSCWIPYDFNQFPPLNKWEDDNVIVDSVCPTPSDFTETLPINEELILQNKLKSLHEKEQTKLAKIIQKNWRLYNPEKSAIGKVIYGIKKGLKNSETQSFS